MEGVGSALCLLLVFAFCLLSLHPSSKPQLHTVMLFVVLISFVAGLLTYFSSLVCANFVYSVKMIDCIKVFNY